MDEEEHLYYYQEGEVDVSDFQNAINNLKAVRFTQEQPEQQKEIGLTIFLDNEQHPQVVIDGEPVSLVERSAVVELVEKVHEIVLG